MIAVITGLVLFTAALAVFAALVIGIRREERGVKTRRELRNVSLTNSPPTLVSGLARRMLGVYVNAPSLRMRHEDHDRDEVAR